MSDGGEGGEGALGVQIIIIAGALGFGPQRLPRCIVYVGEA